MVLMEMYTILDLEGIDERNYEDSRPLESYIHMHNSPPKFSAHLIYIIDEPLNDDSRSFCT